MGRSAQIAALNLRPSRFHGEWNYTFSPPPRCHLGGAMPRGFSRKDSLDLETRRMETGSYRPRRVWGPTTLTGPAGADETG